MGKSQSLGSRLIAAAIWHASCPREDGYTAKRPCLVSAVACWSKRLPRNIFRYISIRRSSLGFA
ncbi:Uncharacterised protein [Mycobacteroides abscessus subsp. abscessus]|nr:Uncharacterised protein [Mycobacteroides abscessus subsp. abscessus]